MSDNKIFVVTFEPFPIGMAATNRILSWSKVLAQNDIDIKILILKPTEKEANIFNPLPSGIVGAIYYEYLNGFTVWKKNENKLSKIFLLIKSHFILLKKIKTEKPSSIVTYSPFTYTKVILIIFRTFFKFKLIIEETEYPKVVKIKTSFINRIVNLYSYRLADKMIVMTKELEDYYKTKLKVKQVFHLPMSVDYNRFDRISSKNKTEDYFIYVGGQGGFYRDGVDDILNAFSLFHRTHQEYYFYIVGKIDVGTTVYQDVIQIVDKSNIKNHIRLLGHKKPNEIPDLLINAKAIVMAPKKNFSSGGFPTKLGEFLASKRPVICTTVSEIPMYLDDSNSFIVSPGDIIGISEKMKFIAENEEFSNKIGVEGYNLCKSVFNVESYRIKLLNFLLN